MTVPVAVIADAHLHHPSAWSLPFPALHPWEDVRSAPRAVNESLLALHAAKDEIRARGVRHVVLLGDYSDDGQRANLAAVARLMATASDLTFTCLPGNHDGWGLAGKHTATRFGRHTVTSDPDLDSPDTHVTAAAFTPGLPEALPPFLSTRHLETPFGTSAAYADRLYTARSQDGTVTVRLPDASFLCEPAPGLWLLHLDANVFEPVGRHVAPERKRGLKDPATAGWDAVLRQKPYLLEWIADISSRAARSGATLVALSHYPVLDPYKDALHRHALLGAIRETRVIPPPHVARALAGAGLRLILSGHLHTAGITEEFGLLQVAVPSTCAFPAGFAILHPGPRVEWVSLAESPIVTFGYPADTPPTLGPFLERQARARFLDRLPRDWPPEAAHRALAEKLPDGTPLAEALADAELLRKAGPFAADYLSPARIDLLRHLSHDDPMITQHLHSIPPALARMGRKLPES